MAHAHPAPEVVEGFLHGYGCWNRRELAEMMDGYAPDAEVDYSALLLDEGVHRGRQAIAAFYARLREVWSGVSWEPEEVIDAGDDAVVVVVRIATVGKRSGVALGDRFAVLYRLRGRAVVQALAYPSRGRALEAARLGAIAGG